MDKKNILHMDIKDLFKSDIKVNPKNILILVGAFLGLFIYMYFILYPKFNEYMKVNNNLNEAKSKLEADQYELDTRPQLTDKLYTLNEEVNTKSKKLSYDMQDGMFLVGLSNMMSKNGIELIKYNVDTYTKCENFYAVPTILEVRGDYRYIREMMYYLEEQKNVTQIQNFNMETYIEPENIVFDKSNALNSSLGNINMTTNKENKAKGKVTATFKFVMYMSQEPNLKLETENPSNWNPGKFNPFVDTTK
ncbi:MAG: type 4a pilus biogenesis protein PilO [Paraclostridium sp.]|uniref:type 4a pilus biogenesis protein PilO n=1 Tax=Paraclostridium sp. TaxID=2023273 RepID=UPI003F2FA658